MSTIEIECRFCRGKGVIADYSIVDGQETLSVVTCPTCKGTKKETVND